MTDDLWNALRSAPEDGAPLAHSIDEGPTWIGLFRLRTVEDQREFSARVWRAYMELTAPVVGGARGVGGVSGV